MGMFMAWLDIGGFIRGGAVNVGGEEKMINVGFFIKT